jgi:endonuclease YncB( thermonuclease family)
VYRSDRLRSESVVTKRPFNPRTLRGRPTRSGARLLRSDVLWSAIIVGALALSLYGPEGSLPRLTLPKLGAERTVAESFPLCGMLHHDDCVIDGDTFRYRGERIRVADIDAPETHPPRCDREAALGTAATRRLQALLNAAPFTLAGIGRDRDDYGRELRVVTRDGQSLGAVLVSEGLARTWTGRRLPWC